MNESIGYEEDAEQELLKKYLRIGWVDRGYRADNFAKKLSSTFEGDILPPYWQYRSIEHFKKKFGDKTFHWAKTFSFHLMIHRGHRVCRLWTDCPTAAILDISDELAAYIKSNNAELREKIVDIQPKVLAKCTPMTKRINLVTEAELDSVITIIKGMYGIQA